MAELSVYRRSVVVEPPGPIRIDVGSGSLLRQATQTLDATAADLNRDAAAGIVADQVEAGRRAGAATGPNGEVNFNLLPNDSASGRAFNAGALEAYQASLGNAAHSRAAELAAQHQNDPEAFRKAWQGEMSGRLSAIPKEFQGRALMEFQKSGEGAYRAIVAQKAANDRQLQHAELVNAGKIIEDEAYQGWSKGGTFDGKGDSTGFAEASRARFEENQDAMIRSGFQTQSGKALAMRGYEAKMRQGFWMHAFNESAGASMDRGNIMGGLQAVQRISAAIRKDSSIPEDEKLRLVANQHHFFAQRASTLMQIRSEGDYQAGQRFTKDLVGLTKRLNEATLTANETGDYTALAEVARSVQDMSTGGRPALDLRREQLKGQLEQQAQVGQQTTDMRKALNSWAEDWQRATRLSNGEETDKDPRQDMQNLLRRMEEQRDATPEHLRSQMTSALTHYLVQFDSYSRSAQKLYEDQAKYAFEAAGFTKASGGAKLDPAVEEKYGAQAAKTIASRMEESGFNPRLLNTLSPGSYEAMIRGTAQYKQLLTDTDLMDQVTRRVANPNASASPSQDVADFMVRALGGKANVLDTPEVRRATAKMKEAGIVSLEDPNTLIHIAKTSNFIPSYLTGLVDGYARSSSVEAIRKGMEMWQAFESHLPKMVGSIGSAETQAFFRLMSERAFTAPDDVSTMKLANQVREQIQAGVAEAPKVLASERTRIYGEINKAFNDLPTMTALIPGSDLAGYLGVGSFPATREGLPIQKGSAFLGQRANLITGSGLDNVDSGVIAPPSFSDDVAREASRRMAINPSMEPAAAVREAISSFMNSKQGDRPIYGVSQFVQPGRNVVTAHPIEIYAPPAVGGARTIKDAAVTMAIVQMTGRPPGALEAEMTASPDGRTKLEKEFLDRGLSINPLNIRDEIKDPSIVFNPRRMGYEIYFTNSNGRLEPVRNYRTGEISLMSADDFQAAYSDPKTGYMYATRHKAMTDATSVIRGIGDTLGMNDLGRSGIWSNMGDALATALYWKGRMMNNDTNTLKGMYEAATRAGKAPEPPVPSQPSIAIPPR